MRPSPQLPTSRGRRFLYGQIAAQGTKLKTYTVNVNGFVVGGVGYGTATCKKPAVSWPVMVK